jgi:hypothetical protein
MPDYGGRHSARRSTVTRDQRRIKRLTKEVEVATPEPEPPPKLKTTEPLDVFRLHEVVPVDDGHDNVILGESFFVPVQDKKYFYKAETDDKWELFSMRSKTLARISAAESDGRVAVLLVFPSEFDPPLKKLHFVAVEESVRYLEKRFDFARVVGAILLPLPDEQIEQHNGEILFPYEGRVELLRHLTAEYNSTIHKTNVQNRSEGKVPIAVDLCLNGSLKGARYPLAHIGIYAKARLFVQRPRVVVKVIEVRIQDTGLAPVGTSPQRRYDSVYIGGSSSDWEKNVLCAQDLAEINNIIVETPGTALEISPVTQYFYQRTTFKELEEFMGMDSREGRPILHKVVSQIAQFDEEVRDSDKSQRATNNQTKPKIEQRAKAPPAKGAAGNHPSPVAASQERVVKRMQRIDKEHGGENAFEIATGKEAWSGGAGGKIRFGQARPLVEAGTSQIVSANKWSGVNQRVVNPKIDFW